MLTNVLSVLQHLKELQQIASSFYHLDEVQIDLFKSIYSIRFFFHFVICNFILWLDNQDHFSLIGQQKIQLFRYAIAFGWILSPGYWFQQATTEWFSEVCHPEWHVSLQLKQKFSWILDITLWSKCLYIM